MSQINIKKIKLGDNADTSKNFLISTPAVADGTLTIEREDGTDILTVDASGKVTIPNLNVQTWQDVKTTPGRVLGTTYTNSTGLPIKCSIFGTCTGDFSFVATVGGISFNGSVAYGTPKGSYIYFEVPAGATYVVNTTGGTIIQWMELR